jgi:hypothetical protein
MKQLREEFENWVKNTKGWNDLYYDVAHAQYSNLIVQEAWELYKAAHHSGLLSVHRGKWDEDIIECSQTVHCGECDKYVRQACGNRPCGIKALEQSKKENINE